MSIRREWRYRQVSWLIFGIVLINLFALLSLFVMSMASDAQWLKVLTQFLFLSTLISLYIIAYFAQKRIYALRVSHGRRQKRLREQYHTATERERFFLLSLDMLCIIDANGCFKQLNPAWERVLGYPLASIRNSPFLEFVHPNDKAGAKKTIDDMLNASNSQTAEFETKYCCADGSYKWLLWSAVPDYDKRAIYAVARDITAIKNMERMKNEFISTINHELRTPLTSINGSLKLILANAAGDVPTEIRQLIKIANKNCDRLLRMIAEILDIEKIESGQLDFKRQVFSLESVLRQAIKSNQSYAEQFKVRLDYQKSTPEFQVIGDPDRIRQVIDNLLSNAIKFSPDDGSVEVRLCKKQSCMRVAVTDYGRGIPDEFRSNIFKRFAQADASDAREKGGTGLGLYISKKIIEMHQGHINYESEAAVKTTFYFELPIAENQ